MKDFKWNNNLPYEKINKKIIVKGIKVEKNKTSEMLNKYRKKLFIHKNLISKNDYNIILIDNKYENDFNDLVEEEYELSMNNYNFKEIINKFLPNDVNSPSSYETIGHIAHLNLKSNQYDYKFWIGKIILEKNKNLKTICNKIEPLNNEFRTPILELIAGENNYVTKTKENKWTTINLDFEKCYYCSRLEYERTRCLKLVKNNEFIVDVFGGVGPFSLRASVEKKCVSYCNDLNGECFKFLKLNIEKNKVKKLITPFNMDGRKFIEMVLDYLKNGKIKKVDHYYMNLPGDAIEFLDIVDEFFNKNDFKDIYNSIFHVYTFQKGKTLDEAKVYLLERVKKIFKNFLKEDFIYVNEVKNVSTNVKMLVFGFSLKSDLFNPLRTI